MPTKKQIESANEMRDIIKEAYDEGYKKGYADGSKEGYTYNVVLEFCDALIWFAPAYVGESMVSELSECRLD